MHNVKFSENRAVRGFRWNVLLNAFYYFSFIYFVFAFSSFNAVAFIAFMQLSFLFLMQLSISAFNGEFTGNALFAVSGEMTCSQIINFILLSPW